MTIDPAVSLQELAEHEGALRGLARWLTVDPEDLEQETRLRWLQRGASVRDAKAWLGTAMRRLASNFRRGEKRRVARERAAAVSEEVPSHADLVARSEVFALLVGVVNELPEQRRDVVVLLFFLGLDVREVAVRLGVKAARVYELRKAALEDLRQRLDARYDRSTWMGMLVPFAGGREVVGVGASSGKSATMGVKGFGVLGVVVTIMNKKVVAAALSVLVLLGVGVLAGLWPEVETAADGDLRAAVRTADLEGQPVAGINAETQDRSLATSAADTAVNARSADSEFGSLRLWLRWHDNAPAVGVSVFLSMEENQAYFRRGVSGEDGRVDFDRLKPWVYGICTWQMEGLWPTARVEAAKQTELDIRFGPGVSIFGTVLDAQGSPAPGATVELTNDDSDDVLGPVEVARADAAGAFLVRAAPLKSVLVARSGCSASAPVVVEGVSGASRSVTLRFDAPGGIIRGVVSDRTGKPISGAIVAAGDIGLGGVLKFRERAGGECVSGSDGRFEIAGVAQGAWKIHVLAAGYAELHTSCEVVGGKATDLTLGLAAVTTVRGVVSDESGLPIPGARVVWSRSNFRDGYSYHNTSASGMFALECFGVERVELAIEKAGYSACHVSVAVGGDVPQDLSVTLRKGQHWGGSVVDSAGRGIIGAWIWFDGLGVNLPREETQADGSFLAANVPSGDVVVNVYADGYEHLIFRALSPGELPAKLTLQRASEAQGRKAGADRDIGGRIVGRIVGCSRKPIGACVGVVGGPAAWSGGGLTGEDGLFEVKGLQCGRHYVRFSADNYLPQTLAFDLSAGQVLDVGTVMMGPCGHVCIQRIESDAALLAGVTMEVGDDLAGESEDWELKKEPLGRRLPVLSEKQRVAFGVGHYFIDVCGRGIQRQRVPFEVHAGVTTNLTITVRAGIPQRIEWRYAMDAELLRPAQSVGVITQDGRVVESLDCSDVGGECEVYLEPGEYTIRVNGRVGAEDRCLGSTAFRVADTEGMPVVLDLR